MLYLRLIATAVVLFAFNGRDCFGNVVYTTTPYTFHEDGYSYAGGTITTNGSFGEINPSNVSSMIIEWQLTFTSPLETYTLTTANSAVTYFDKPNLPEASPHLQATPTNLIFPGFPISTDQDYLHFTFGNQRISYLSQPPDLFSKMILHDGDYFISDAFSTETQSAGSSNTIAILSVPEPSGLGLIGWLSAILIPRQRRRRLSEMR